VRRVGLRVGAVDTGLGWIQDGIGTGDTFILLILCNLLINT
jgi:hypothetical protein